MSAVFFFFFFFFKVFNIILIVRFVGFVKFCELIKVKLFWKEFIRLNIIVGGKLSWMYKRGFTYWRLINQRSVKDSANKKKRKRRRVIIGKNFYNKVALSTAVGPRIENSKREDTDKEVEHMEVQSTNTDNLLQFHISLSVQPYIHLPIHLQAYVIVERAIVSAKH